MANNRSTLTGNPQNGELLKPLPFGGTTSPVRLNTRGNGTDDVALQGSPITRLMGPSMSDGPSQENSNMKYDTDDRIDGQRNQNGDQDDRIVNTREIPDPTENPTERKRHRVDTAPLTIPERERIEKVVEAKEMARLSERVSVLYKQVADNMSQSPENAAQAFTWLNDARRILYGNPGQYTLAELQIHQTELLLKQVQTSDADAKTYQTRLISWNLFWLAFFTALFAFDGAIANWLLNMNLITPPAALANTDVGLSPTLMWYFQPWLSVLVGGIGGALAAITVLGRSISRREYDSALNLDYYLNAIKGAILGGVIYYILLGGFITVAATTTIASDAGNLAQRIQVAGSPLFILMGFIAGFAQQRILALLPQVWGNVTGSGGKKDESTSSIGQSSIESVPVQTQAIGMNTRHQLPYNGNSYNGNNVPPVSHPAAAPDNAYYQNDPSAGINGQHDPSAGSNGQNDFVPFANAGP